VRRVVASWEDEVGEVEEDVEGCWAVCLFWDFF
jgi:hypothetical protein